MDCAEKETLKAGLEILKDKRHVIFLSNQVAEQYIALANSYNASFVLTAHSFDDLIKQAEKTKATDVTNIILNLVTPNPGNQIQNNTILRRSALRKNFKPFGYPLFTEMNFRRYVCIGCDGFCSNL